ncbi:MAG: LPS export ABC transporter periplasmic protein LptC, partial [Endomicrobiia bacterium]
FLTSSTISNFVSIFISLFITYYSLLILSCKTKENIKQQIGEPEQVLKNFTAFESKEGKKIWRLVAEEAMVYESEKIVILKNFSVNFFSEEGNKSVAILKAPSGRINSDTNDFFTEGKTLLKTNNNEILECKNLIYRSSLRKIFSDSEVKLTRKDAIITGKGIEATPDLSSIIIKENIVEIKK